MATFSIETLEGDVNNAMTERVEFFQLALDAIRTGKASPALVQDLMIEAWGSKMKLRDVANIGAPEPRLITIQPYDISVLPSIEKAIIASDLGITPMSDGQIIRLPTPELTEERRKDLVKGLKAKLEEVKVEVRKIRQTGNDIAKKAQKSSEITEDDLKSKLDDIQKSTDKFTKELTTLADAKEKELMTV